MYAAAGGASIASRRKQKRLQLSKQFTPQPPASSRTKAPSKASRGVYTTKFLSSHIPTTSTTTATTTTLYLPAPPPSSAFISSHEHHRHRRRRSPGKPATPYRLTPLVSPIQFPISPPPLSLESSNSLSLPLHSNNFPFPPSAFLDLRVSPTTSEFQCGSQGPGKAAWQGCSRPSPLPLSPSSLHGSRSDGYNKTKQCEAHRRWMKRNRIRDVSYCYGSSEEDDEDGSWTGRRRPEMNAAMNTVLYAGLGTTALGLVISFVGTGEKGFLSPELRLLGPTLLCAGLLCCLLRVLLCLCLCRCGGDCQWKPCRIVIVDNKKVRKAEKVLASPSRQCASLLPQCSNQTTTLTTRTTTTMMAMSPLPCSSSHSDTLKGHELLLSPAQLPE